MQYLAIATIVVFLAYSVSVGIKNQLVNDSQKNTVSPTPIASMTPSPSPVSSPTAKPSVSSSNSSQPTSSGSSKIEIHTDINSESKPGELLIYPGASTSGDDKNYQTGDSGDTVYTWYKQELEKRSFQIRNNVRTQRNDNFKAVLQAISANAEIKITIDQENSSSKTLITIE